MNKINNPPKNIDELVNQMLERKKERKIENEKKYNSSEFQEFLKKLRSLKEKNNEV